MAKRHYIIPIFVPHEGCPHNCVFCNQGTITGSSVSVDSFYVEETIERYLATINRTDSIVEVSFFGGTFTAINIEKQKQLLSVANRYKESGIIDFIRLSTRPDYINKTILDNLRNYGVDIIELGVQSLDSEVLLKSGRGHTEEEVEKASKLIKEYGFTLGHQIMLGLPGDTLSKDIETTRKIIKMKPDICRIYPSLVIKDTPMEALYKRNEYKPYSLIEAVEISKVVYGMLVSNGIKVIRIGLQPTEEITEGREVVAGPFHPAFRELVEGSIYRDILIKELKHEFKDTVHIKINPKDISKLYANRKCFFSDTKEQLKTLKLIVIQDNSVERENLVLKSDNKCINVSIYEYLLRVYKEGYFHNL